MTGSSTGFLTICSVCNCEKKFSIMEVEKFQMYHACLKSGVTWWCDKNGLLNLEVLVNEAVCMKY